MWYNRGMADQETLKVTLLLEHHEGEEMWTAHVPTLESQPDAQFVPLAEGRTPQEAAAAIVPDLTDGVQRFPGLADQLKSAPRFEITQVDIPIHNQ